MLRHAEESTVGYEESKDRDLVTDDLGFTVEASDMIFKAGQSKRIWNEVYKVYVLLNVLFSICVFMVINYDRYIWNSITAIIHGLPGWMF